MSQSAYTRYLTHSEEADKAQYAGAVLTVNPQTAGDIANRRASVSPALILRPLQDVERLTQPRSPRVQSGRDTRTPPAWGCTESLAALSRYISARLGAVSAS